MEHKLASIRLIDNLQPIPNADKIVLATIGGWKVIVKKDEFNIGDACVYCEIDSVLPERAEFEFLRSRHFRIKTMKMRGVLSQGIAFPLSILTGMESFHSTHVIEVGADVTEILGITKYEAPVSPQLAGLMKGNFPHFLRKTDEERIQNLALQEFQEISGWYVTEKLDGSSFTAYFKDGEFGVCSRNIDLKETPENKFWQVARKYNIENTLRFQGFNCAIQGEMVGPGIQGGHYGFDDYRLYMFNFWDIDNQKYIPLADFKYIYAPSVPYLQSVPVCDTFNLFPFTNTESALSYADGPSILNEKIGREGVVMRSLDLNISFKIISNQWLLKNE